MIQHPPPPTPAQDQMKETVAPDQATTPPYSYDCYGVLRHLGNTLSSGHYISLVKDQGRNCWRKYDDERTVDFDPMRLHGRDRLQNGEAYILFYQRAAPHWENMYLSHVLSEDMDVVIVGDWYSLDSLWRRCHRRLLLAGLGICHFVHLSDFYLLRWWLDEKMIELFERDFYWCTSTISRIPLRNLSGYCTKCNSNLMKPP